MQYQVFHLLKLYQQFYPGKEENVSAQELNDFGKQIIKNSDFGQEVNPYDAANFYGRSDFCLRSILHP